jgi:hypothetical protein
VGGKLVLLKTMPPRWGCVCPKGATRRQTGKNAYACIGSPDGSQPNPKKDCLKRGWKWTRKGCVDPNLRCPKGHVGKPPYCKKLPPPGCPRGYVGKPPNCTKLTYKPCPKGYIGQPPNCKRLSPKKPGGLKDMKKVFKNLKDGKKN